MKICFFMNTPFTLGGEQRVVTEIANYLYSKNIDVNFLLLDKKERINRDIYKLNENIKIDFVKEYSKKTLVLKRQIQKMINKINYKSGIFSHNLKVLKNIYLSKREEQILLSKLKEEKYDYIIGVGLRYTLMLAPLKNNLRDTKLVGWQHSTFEAYFKMKNYRLYNSEMLAQFMFENLDDYIVQTQSDYLKIQDEFNYKSVVINNPNSSFLKNKYNEYTKENYFISTGRFVKLKNYDKIIYAFKQFLNSNNSWKLLLIGDGPEKRNCEKLVKKLGIEEYVIFTGQISNVEKYYEKSKIYICASSFEGWGMSITEAMMFKNAIISYNFPSAREILENKKCGIILDENNIENLYKAMKQLVLNSESLTEIADASFERVKKFDIKNIGKEWLNFIYKGGEYDK